MQKKTSIFFDFTKTLRLRSQRFKKHMKMVYIQKKNQKDTINFNSDIDNLSQSYYSLITQFQL